MERLISIIGPTAVGKTQLSIDLAKILNTEIISGDSMLVYRGMDIGTAKPTLAERAGVPHHLMDILEPCEEFSVTSFIELASKEITEINRKNKIPILAGGTGLYIKALLEGYQFNTTPGDNRYRSELEQLATLRGNQYLHHLLQQVDPQTASRLHPNDQRRIIRALEVYHLGGENISQSKTASESIKYDHLVIGLTMNRQRLYERINHRVDVMMANGLVEEVTRLLHSGIPENCQAMKGIGYKEIVAYIKKEVSLQTAIENIKQSTRHFAKRQITWYKKMDYIHWFDVDSIEDYEVLLGIIYKKIAGKFCLE
jgi:tRNA dimethylallyltransferase